METDRRSMQDRRSGRDRRKLAALKDLFRKARDRSIEGERRQALERRWEWVRLSKWSSVYLASLKLAKFLKPKDRKGPPES